MKFIFLWWFYVCIYTYLNTVTMHETTHVRGGKDICIEKYFENNSSTPIKESDKCHIYDRYRRRTMRSIQV